MLKLAILFGLLVTCWLCLSGMFDITYISFGIFSCLVALSFYASIYKNEIRGPALSAWGIVKYCGWLIVEITKSSIDISLKMWQLEPDISPQTAWIPCDIKDETRLAIIANSITLTPGTVTIGLHEGKFHIHALTIEHLEQLQEGEIIKKVKELVKQKVKGK